MGTTRHEYIPAQGRNPRSHDGPGLVAEQCTKAGALAIRRRQRRTASGRR